MRRFWISAGVLTLCLLAWQRCSPIEHPPGVLVRGEPQQVLHTTSQEPIMKEGWSLKPLATFSLEARVLGVKRYIDDFTASLSPYDLAVGWGRMSDTAVLDRIAITQGNRFYRWRCWGKAPIPEKEIQSHSANIHIIPADAFVAGKLRVLRKGELVKLRGSLVVATHPKASKPWSSSLTRDDEGEGACEVFYVKSLTIQ